MSFRSKLLLFFPRHAIPVLRFCISCPAERHGCCMDEEHLQFFETSYAASPEVQVGRKRRNSLPARGYRHIDLCLCALTGMHAYARVCKYTTLLVLYYYYVELHVAVAQKKEREVPCSID